MQLITTRTFSIIVSGQTGDNFHPERDNSQDYPISPYIFTIFAKHLGRYIHFMSTQKRSGISTKLSKDNPNITYLFADDGLILRQINRLQGILDTYYIITVTISPKFRSSVALTNSIGRKSRRYYKLPQPIALAPI